MGSRHGRRYLRSRILEMLRALMLVGGGHSLGAVRNLRTWLGLPGSESAPLDLALLDLHIIGR
jgi:hypothetical protein